jgi:tripartite-type tricarboxylate transporter receptor subunit TctC
LGRRERARIENFHGIFQGWRNHEEERMQSSSMRRMMAAILAMSGIAAGGAFAQSYPAKPIRLILGFPPGGASDAGARIIAPKLGEALGQQVIVDNRAGANTNIATELVARAQPDGHTLLWGFSNAFVVNPSIYAKLGFDAQKDFAPIMLVAQYQFVLVVHRSVSARTVQELIAQAKSSRPGTFTYASTGIGSPNHLAAELLKNRSGIDITHVAYKGGGPATLAVLSGETKMLFASIPSVLAHVKAGGLRALAVTAPERAPELPDVGTMQELGFPGFDVRAWNGVLAPAGTPQPVAIRLNAELAKIVKAPDVQEGFRREGLEPVVTTPEAFAQRIRAETAMWAKVIRHAGIRAE